MSANSHKLLPSGFEDLLPPAAALEARAAEQISTCFQAHGYERVKPPLLEYRRTLNAEAGGTIADLVFQTQDPLSAQTLGLRADITVQVARIAANQLADLPRPLRLSYAGNIVRRRPGEGRIAREYTQAGIEIIGLDPSYRLSADVEAIRVATSALRRLGIKKVGVDLTLPSLIRDHAAVNGPDAAGLPELLSALDRRDVVRLRAFKQPVLEALLSLNGQAGAMIEKAMRLGELKPFSKQLSDMAELIERLSGVEGLELTLDMCEQRGTAYHQAVGFNFFAKGHPTELGAGGRFSSQNVLSTGATLYLDRILPLLKQQAARQRILVPLSVDEACLERLHAEGRVTVFALCPNADHAKKQNCSHFIPRNGDRFEIKEV